MGGHSADATSDSLGSKVVMFFLLGISVVGNDHLIWVSARENVRLSSEADPRNTNSGLQAAGLRVGTTVRLLGTETVERAPLHSLKLLRIRTFCSIHTWMTLVDNPINKSYIDL